MGLHFPYSDEMAERLRSEERDPPPLPAVIATEPYAPKEFTSALSPDYLVSDVEEGETKSSFTLRNLAESGDMTMVTIWSKDKERVTPEAISQSADLMELLRARIRGVEAPQMLLYQDAAKAMDGLIDALAGELERCSGDDGPVSTLIREKVGEAYYLVLRDMALSRAPSALNRAVNELTDSLEKELGLK